MAAGTRTQFTLATTVPPPPGVSLVAAKEIARP